MIKAIKKWWLYNPYRKGMIEMDITFFKIITEKVIEGKVITPKEYTCLVNEISRSKPLRDFIKTYKEKG